MFTLSRAILICFVAVCACCACLVGAMFGGPVVALVVVCAIAIGVKRGRFLTAFGAATVASEQQVRKNGMLSGKGLIVGTLLGSPRPRLLGATLGLINPFVGSADATNRFLRAIFPKIDVNPSLVRLSQAVHTAVFSPTGGGKGVSGFLPFLLENTDSCVSVDFGGGLAKATMKRRRRMGHRVVLLDPRRSVTNTPDTFNPLDFIDKNAPFVLDEIQDLAESQVIRTGHEPDPHWNDSSAFVISALICAVVQFADADDRSLQTVCGLAADPQKMEMVGTLLRNSDAWDGMLARIGHQLLHYKDKEAASVASTITRQLRYLSTPAIAASTRTSSFDPSELINGKMSVFLILPADAAPSGLLRMWISSFLHAVVKGGLQK